MNFKQLKDSTRLETGNLTNEQIKHYFTKITFFFDDAHKVKLDLRKIAHWEIVKRYALRLKTLFQQDTMPKVAPIGYAAKTKEYYKHTTTPTGRGVAARVAEEFTRMGVK